MARYLAVFQLPSPKPEHIEINNVIRDASAGNFTKLVLGSKTVLYLFDSNSKPHNLDFGRILLGNDEVAFFEVGEYFTATGFRTLQGWLNSHRN